jgi:hypothetical protein
VSSPDYSQDVKDIIDGLGDTPTPDAIYHAVRNYSVDNVVAATASAAKAGGGGGGGSQAVLSATVPLTNAQIKALPGTDIQLVAAPGASKMILPLYAFLTADFAVAYSGIDASSEYPALWVAHARLPIFLAEFINDPDSFATPLTSLTDLLTGTNEFGAILWRMLPLAQSYITGGAPSNAFVIAGGAGPGPSDLDNAPLKIGADNSINFTGGDAANSMKVTVLYTVLDI